MSGAIKFQPSRIVGWGNRLICKGVTIYDRGLYTAFEKDIEA